MDDHDVERQSWDDEHVKRDWEMWREITGGGRTLNEEQQQRYEATNRAMKDRGLIGTER